MVTQLQGYAVTQLLSLMVAQLLGYKVKWLHKYCFPIFPEIFTQLGHHYPQCIGGITRNAFPAVFRGSIFMASLGVLGPP